MAWCGQERPGEQTRRKGKVENGIVRAWQRKGLEWHGKAVEVRRDEMLRYAKEEQ